MKPITFTPIGVLKSDQVEPYQASRQPDDLSSPAIITLNSGLNFEQALTDLSGCSHLWIIYQFHQNENWKPLVQTPRGQRKVGLFATRAPYRPNAIGISVVKLQKVEGLNIFIGPNDILDGTPILDIKPYHPDVDVVTDAHVDWLESNMNQKMQLSFSPQAEAQIDFLEATNSTDLKQFRAFITRQLEYDPTNAKKKRVAQENLFWILSYRTWRVDFLIQDQIVAVLSIHSGYSEADLLSTDDPFTDKEVHRRFLQTFN